MSNNLGEVIRKARIGKGLSQEKLAQESGVNKNTISFIEKGRRKPRIATLRSLAPYIGKDIKELTQLLGGNEVSKNNKLGDVIKKERIGKGLTPEELAQESGVSQCAIWNIENGNTAKPYIETLKKLAPCIGKDIKELTQLLEGNEVSENNNLGEVIRKARKEQGLSQERLAKKSGVNKNTISFIEKGERKPLIATLKKLAPCIRKDIKELTQLLEGNEVSKDDNLGNVIRKERKQQGLTIKKFAKESRVSSNTIIYREKGVITKPQMGVLKRLASYLQVELKELIQLVQSEGTFKSYEK